MELDIFAVILRVEMNDCHPQAVSEFFTESNSVKHPNNNHCLTGEKAVYRIAYGFNHESGNLCCLI